MADTDEAVVDETAADEPTTSDEQVDEPESMDEIIEKEAETELDEEKGEEQPAEEEAEPEAEAEEAEPKEEAEEEVEEEEPEPEPEPIDKSSFSQAGIDAVPEDYKPESWQAFMKDMVDVVRGEVYKETQAATEQQQAFQAEVASVDEGWKNEISELQKGGDLPKDSKELETATKEVFDYMAKNNQKYESDPNKQIWSFETAYKLMNANKVTDERKTEIASRRKGRASRASGAGNADGGSGIPRQAGESMDDIITRELGL